MSSVLRVENRSAPGAAIIDLVGDVNADGEADITAAYHAAVADGSDNVLINLADAQYINTSGISVLISVVMEAKKSGVSVAVSGASPHYRKVFDLVRFSSFVTMYDDEDAALAALA